MNNSELSILSESMNTSLGVIRNDGASRWKGIIES